MGENRQEFKTGREAAETADAPLTNHQLEDGDMAPANSKRSPAFQFYARDFLSSPKVDRMAMTERGAYITLLSRCWLDNGLSTDLSELAYFCRMKPAPFERMWTTGQIGKCFHERAGKFHNERLDLERKKQTANRQRQSDNAAAGWQRRRNASALPVSDASSGSGITRADAPAADAKSNSNLQISSPSSEEKKRAPGFDGQKAFMAFQAAYPENRRKGGFLLQQQFLAAVDNAGGYARLMAALENHIASEQWSNPKHIPGMDVWFNEERWRQELPAAGAATSSQNNPKTAGNVPVFRRFIERGGRPA